MNRPLLPHPSKALLLAPWFLLLGAGLLLPGLTGHSQPASASPPEEQAVFTPVITEVGPGWVNWTEFLVHVSAEAFPDAGPYAERTVVEQKAHTSLEPRMVQTGRHLRISADTTGADILDDGSNLGRILAEDLAEWHVAETRYYSSGRLEVDGELELLTWLRPLFIDLARTTPLPDQTPSRTTGVVVDARGLPLEPAVLPRLWSPSGDLLYSIQSLGRKTARERTPILYVRDPADPRAVERAGANPLFVRAKSIRNDVDLVLDNEGSIRFRTVSRDAHLPGEARVVVIVGT